LPIRYTEAADVKKLADEIIDRLGLFHVVPQFMFCFRSTGSTSKRTIARIHGLGKIWQEALNLPPSYTIEVISERYDRLSQTGKEKTIIHELLHVPRGFAGGFRPHKGYIDERIVDDLYRKLQEHRKNRTD
jgi:predicted metallopeptidase